MRVCLCLLVASLAACHGGVVISATGEPAPDPDGGVSVGDDLPHFTIEELPPVEGFAELQPLALNSKGDVVGMYQPGGMLDTPRSFIYEAVSGTTRRIRHHYPSEDMQVIATGINDDRQVAVHEGYRWQEGVMTSIEASNPGWISSANGVSANGWIVGCAGPTGASGWSHAVLWDGVSLRDLSPTANGLTDGADINSKGQVVGQAWDHAAVFEQGMVRDLGTLEGHSMAYAVAISDNGRVVGYSGVLVRLPPGPAGGSDSRWVVFGFIYDLPNGPMRGFLRRPGAFVAVNASGDAVGYTTENFGPPDGAILWFRDKAIDLTAVVGDPSWALSAATGINDKGQIVGWGQHGGKNRGFFLTPR